MRTLSFLILLSACATAPATPVSQASTAGASASASMPANTASEAPMPDLTLTRLDGAPLDKATLDGKVVLYVNVASKCGFTPQYKGLQALHDTYADKGFTVVGVPCNQFGGQEPGSPEQIATFCQRNYGVTFPILQKQDVNGPGRSELYTWLVNSSAGGGKDIGWNFEKFLVDRQGKVVAHWASRTAPQDAELVAAIEKAL